jgi:hypothetical protein
MNRKQIKTKREYLERQIDMLMSRGYSGSEDENFKRACAECRKHEEQLRMLATAAEEINTKSRNTRRTNRWAQH